MGNLWRILSLISFVIGIVISFAVYAQYSETQGSVMEIMSQNMNSAAFGEEEDQPPTLSTVTVAAPAAGSEAKIFEVEHVDAEKATAEIIYDDGTQPREEVVSEDVAAVEKPQLPEDATLGEKAKFYFDMASVWLFGEREEKVEMKCKAKAGGGKVCTVSRG